MWKLYTKQIHIDCRIDFMTCYEMTHEIDLLCPTGLQEARLIKEISRER